MPQPTKPRKGKPEQVSPSTCLELSVTSDRNVAEGLSTAMLVSAICDDGFFVEVTNEP